MQLGPIAERAALQSDEPAVTDDRRQLTWGALADESRALAATFADHATGPDARIAVLGENTAETIVAHVAGLAAGIGTVALSRQLTAGELADQIADSGAVLVVSGPTSVAAAIEACRQTRSALITHNCPTPAAATDWEAVVAADARADDAPPLGPPRPMIVYTSGTTGRARGTEVRWLPRSFGTAADYLTALAARPGFPAGPHLVVGPLQHNGPLTSLRHVMTGQPLVVLGHFDAERVLELIEEHHVTSSVMVPTHLQRLLALDPGTRSAHDHSSLELIAHTGSACPAQVKRDMIAWWGPIFSESYGGSEIGTVCRISSAEWLEHPGSVGRCVPPFEPVVVDENGRELPPGATGILGFRVPAEYDVEYVGDPEKTASAHLMPGVATLGDVGHVDADGYVHITDRVSDMVISGGVNLYPAEIEKALLEHPKVVEAAVIGVPDHDLGEALLAVITAADPALSAADLMAFLRIALAAYKVPRQYDFHTPIPRNPMGKIDKRALRSQLAPAPAQKATTR